MTDSQRAAQLAAAACAEKKAQDILILDIREISLIADFFIICSGRSTTQVQAIAGEVEDKLSQEGILLLRREGLREARWVLLDYGSIVIHIFLEQERRFYDLERLWGDASVVPLKSLSGKNDILQEN